MHLPFFSEIEKPNNAVAVARHTRARPPPLGPPTGPGHRRCRPPLPPARAEPHPPHLVPPGVNLHPPHPHQESRKPPCSPPFPLPPTTTTTPMTSAVSKPQGTRRRRTIGHRPPSPRHCRRPGRRGGRGAEHSALLLPGLCSRSVGCLRMVISGHCHCCWGLGRGGAPAAAVAGRGGSDGRGSSGGDNDMICRGMCGRIFCVLLVAV